MASVIQLQCFYFLLLITSLPATLAESIPLKMPLSGYPRKCGNITISLPFIISTGCYRNGFDIRCEESTTSKAFLGSDSRGYVAPIENKITAGETHVSECILSNHFIESDQVDVSNDWAAIVVRGSPYLLYQRCNMLTVIGSDNLAYLDNDSDRAYLSAGVSVCDSLNSKAVDGGSRNGLGWTTVPGGVNYNETALCFHYNNAWLFNPCSYTFLVEKDFIKFHVQDESSSLFIRCGRQDSLQLTNCKYLVSILQIIITTTRTTII